MIRLAAATLLALWQFASGAADAAEGQAEMLDNPLAARTIDAFSVTRARPLFAPDRRPATRIAPPAPVLRSEPGLAVRSEAPPPRVDLVGVVGIPGQRRAMLRRTGGGETLRVRDGDSVDGWRVARIDPRRIVLAEGDRRIEIELFGNESDR